MLTNNEHPVAWAMLIYELADAQDHLGALINQMRVAGGIDESDFGVQLGHVFAHLNRAWHARNDPHLDAEPDELRAARSRYPVDLPPVG